MILSFSKDDFKEKILTGSKVTTIRQDKGKRWRFGLSIEFWRGSPRNPSQNPYKFGVAICSFAKPIIIDIANQRIYFDYQWWKSLEHKVDIDRFIIGDGFANQKEFFQFFKDTYQTDYFEGVLIGWHNFIAVNRKEVTNVVP